jgi:hypothetical protein
LRYQQQAALRIANINVHFAGGIFKDPVRHQTLSKPVNLGGGIPAFDGNENKETGSDLPDNGPIDPHTGLRYALQQCDHGERIRVHIHEISSYLVGYFGLEIDVDSSVDSRFDRF